MMKEQKKEFYPPRRVLKAIGFYRKKGRLTRPQMIVIGAWILANNVSSTNFAGIISLPILNQCLNIAKKYQSERNTK